YRGNQFRTSHGIFQIAGCTVLRTIKTLSIGTQFVNRTRHYRKNGSTTIFGAIVKSNISKRNSSSGYRVNVQSGQLSQIIGCSVTSTGKSESGGPGNVRILNLFDGSTFRQSDIGRAVNLNRRTCMDGK